MELQHSASRGSSYSFSDFTIDLAAERLVRGTQEIKLRPKSFEVMRYLVEHHGRLVTRDELMQAVWGDIAVTDESITKCIGDIRKALNDDAQEIIRTVTRKGFLFQVEVRVIPPPERLQKRPVFGRARIRYILAGVLVLLGVAGGVIFGRLKHPAMPGLTYTQITNFTDSAVGPVLSPDGRMVAFFRSSDVFITRDQIYVKQLPNGTPVQLTHDSQAKYGLAFSPDGSRIAYTVTGERPVHWNTYTVSVLGGKTSPLLTNAAGLSWLDERRILFSEIKTGLHMGVVTATESRADYRSIYFPEDERGMAHYSYASPDRKWVLLAEMNPVWQPCRVVPMYGGGTGRQAGPAGKCRSAAWSPDGNWMYFSVEIDGKHHLWRQRFPDGQPQQITSGPTEEDGVAMAPDGRSLITSIGMAQGALWIHDAEGEHALSSEGQVIGLDSNNGFGSIPVFSANGTWIYYLRRDSPGAPAELWRTEVKSRKSEALAPGVSMLEFDISRDGKEVVFSSQPPGKPSQIWFAMLDRSSPPVLVTSTGDTAPHFGQEGQILFRLTEGTAHYVGRMQRDGTGRSKAAPYPIGNIESISPDRRWILAIAPMQDGGSTASTVAVPVEGGNLRRICELACPAAWAPDGKVFYILAALSSLASPGKTLAIPVPPGEVFPELPPSGIGRLNDGSTLPGVRILEASIISPAPDPSVYAYVKAIVHRNLFRIPLHE